jgi:hypothetical protein
VSETLDTLRRLSSAEDLLSYFRIPFDQRVLDIHRMRILKQANGFLNGLPVNGAGDDELYELFRAFLYDSYQVFAERSEEAALPPEEGRLPKAAALRPSSAFVPLDAVIGIKRRKDA